jgi:hypothetical protein
MMKRFNYVVCILFAIYFAIATYGNFIARDIGKGLFSSMMVLVCIYLALRIRRELE